MSIAHVTWMGVWCSTCPIARFICFQKIIYLYELSGKQLAKPSSMSSAKPTPPSLMSFFVAPVYQSESGVWVILIDAEVSFNKRNVNLRLILITF